jgi:hypothetical protein
MLMTAEGGDAAVAAPFEFRAVTRMRSVLPTSDCRVTYVLPVAPEIGVQLPPLLLHVRHW